MTGFDLISMLLCTKSLNYRHLPNLLLTLIHKTFYICRIRTRNALKNSISCDTYTWYYQLRINLKNQLLPNSFLKKGIYDKFFIVIF